MIKFVDYYSKLIYDCICQSFAGCRSRILVFLSSFFLISQAHRSISSVIIEDADYLSVWFSFCPVLLFLSLLSRFSLCYLLLFMWAYRDNYQ